MHRFTGRDSVTVLLEGIDGDPVCVAAHPLTDDDVQCIAFWFARWLRQDGCLFALD